MSGLNLSFSSEDHPSQKIFFLGALAGLAKAGARAGIWRTSGAIRPRPRIPSVLKLRSGDINITTNKKENQQSQQPLLKTV